MAEAEVWDDDEGLRRARLRWALEAFVRSTRALVHFEGLEDLFDNVCRAICADDRYVAAGVALAETGPDEPLRLVSTAGAARAYLDGLTLSASATRIDGSGPTGRAMRSGSPVVMRDSMKDRTFAPWRARAAPFGIRSSVTIPFKVVGVVRGVLLVYSQQVDAFGSREMDLFAEFAEQLAFAISVEDDRARLAATASDYKLLADNVHDIIIRYDRDRIARYVSPSISQLGYRPDDLIGRMPVDLVHPDDVPQASRALYGRQELPVRFRVRCADGQWKWLEGTPSFVLGPHGTLSAIVVTFRDVTERCALEDELRRNQAEAEAGTQAKSEFLANMSHEIRTPLTAIAGYSQLLQGSPGLTRAERGFVDRIVTASHALQAIVDQILDFSELGGGQVELERGPFDPHALMDECIALFASAAEEKGIQLAGAASGPLPRTVITDERRVRQALLALLDNALKFTEAGQVRVAVTFDAAEGGSLRFAVSDTGIGIPPARAARLFEGFSQIDSSATRRHGGAGLGLAISKSLVDRMGGEIGYSSQEGGGSTFWFSVPAPAGEATEAPAHPSPPEAAAAPRILVVDDAPINRELVAAMLDTAACELEFAEDGAQALEMAAARRYDLILMDMQMPVMDGPSATRAIRSSDGPNSRTPVIAVSANVLPMHVQACLDAGMDDHIPKPISGHGLMSKVGHWLGRTHGD